MKENIICKIGIRFRKMGATFCNPCMDRHDEPSYLCKKHNKDNMDKDYNKGISRRSALKRMGLLFAGAACMGMPALTSCNMETKKRIIFYFTGTGNCLYVARQLANEHTELLSIPQLVKQGRYTFEADEIGIVYPVYGHMPPNMVREFIKKAHLKATYKFAILTYGNRKCSSVEIWDDISRKAGCPFDYITTMIMVDNWLPNFDMNEQIKIDKHIPESLERITADLSKQRHWHEPVTELERQQHAGFLQASGVDPETGFLMHSQDAFLVTDACIDCGICTEVCPRGNYELASTGVTIIPTPVTVMNTYHCGASKKQTDNKRGYRTASPRLFH